MRKSKVSFISVFLILFLGACATTQEPRKSVQKSTAIEKIWVTKPDGALSCGEKAGEKPAEVAQALEKLGVKVYKFRGGHDGKMHMMVCGAETGTTIELFINAKDLSLAEEQGFRLKETK